MFVVDDAPEGGVVGRMVGAVVWAAVKKLFHNFDKINKASYKELKHFEISDDHKY